MGRKHGGSLAHQLHQRMEQLNCIGQSRHMAKIEAKALGRNSVVGIHSEATYETYKGTSKALAAHLKEQGIKSLSEVQETHLKAFLEHRKGQGVAPATLDRDLAACNKLFGTQISKREAQLPVTSYKDVTRGRAGQTGRYDPEKWQDQMKFSQATGVRRESIDGGKGLRSGAYRVTAASVWRRTSDGRLMVSVIEKGGKYREIPVLREREKELQEIVERRSGQPIQEREGFKSVKHFKDFYKQSGSKPLFDRYTKEINNHAFRREYAQNRYQERLQELGREDRKDHRGYDKEALAQVSKDLGHGRLDVVVEHYMR